MLALRRQSCGRRALRRLGEKADFTSKTVRSITKREKTEPMNGSQKYESQKAKAGEI